MGRAMSDQMRLAEALLHPKLGANAKLDGMHGQVDWGPIGRLAAKVRAPATTGRKPYLPLAMLEVVYLQAAYDLGDKEMEEALADRLSFRRFCGFGLEEGTPDETTIWRFREAAMTAGVLEAAFAEIDRQLEAKGLILKKGTLLDATLVRAKHAPPARAAGLGAAHAKEPDASWTKKGGKAYFGYKAHVGVDQGSGLVRSIDFTSAKINDGEVADGLICGDEAAVYADKAYEQKERRARLKAAGIKDRIMHRRHKHIARLPRWQEKRNGLIARRRAPVEAVFSAAKRLYGLARARYASLVRNAARAMAVFTVYNLRRAALLAGP
jgi:IS5 family transposase